MPLPEGLLVRNEKVDLVRGTLDMLVLKALVWGPMHGYDVLNWLKRISEGDLGIDEGALYPSLHRMEERGWITAEWGLSENNRRAKFYELTDAGRAQLHEQRDEWGRYTRVVDRILEAAPGGER